MVESIVAFIVGKLWEEGLKKAFKYLLDYLGSLVFKNGKFNFKRAKWIFIWLALAWVIYQLPCWLLQIQPVTKNAWLNEIINLLNDHNYLQLSQYFLLSVLAFFTTLLALLTSASVTQNVAALSEFDANVIGFVKDVSLKGGNRCASDEEKREAKREIASKIQKSNRVKIMVINGHHDLADNSSEIHRALSEKNRLLDLKVLLLDPFSEYSVRRADQLLPEVDVALSRMRYIYDYFRTIDALDVLSKKAGTTVTWRTYCSNPFFRMYLLDRELVLQTYQASLHGHGTPLYNFAVGERSLFTAGQEIFNYYWNKGFIFTDDSLKEKGASLTVYLGGMYGLHDDGKIPSDVDKLRKDILEYVEEKKAAAFDLGKKGLLTDYDG